MRNFQIKNCLKSYKSEICKKNLKEILKVFWGDIEGIYRKYWEDFIEMWKIYENVMIFEKIFERIIGNG